MAEEQFVNVFNFRPVPMGRGERISKKEWKVDDTGVIHLHVYSCTSVGCNDITILVNLKPTTGSSTSIEVSF